MHAGSYRGHNRKILQLIMRDGRDCWLCGLPVSMRTEPGHVLAPSIDHLLRRQDGGGNALHNLRLAHRICNSRREDRLPDDPYWKEHLNWMYGFCPEPLAQAIIDAREGFFNHADRGRIKSIEVGIEIEKRKALTVSAKSATVSI